MASRILEALEGIERMLAEETRRGVSHVVDFIAREFNSAINASAEVSSVRTDDGFENGNVIMVCVADRAAPNGTRTFKVTVEEWDV